MYRSWGYILMFAATLAGVVALLWPTPPVRTIDEITMPARPATRPEPPSKPPKQAAKPSPPKPKPAPPAVVDRMPQQNTTTRRGAAVPQNGLQPNMFGQPTGAGVLDRGAPPSAPAPAITARPTTPPPPPAPPVSQDAAP